MCQFSYFILIPAYQAQISFFYPSSAPKLMPFIYYEKYIISSYWNV